MRAGVRFREVVCRATALATALAAVLLLPVACRAPDETPPGEPATAGGDVPAVEVVHDGELAPLVSGVGTYHREIDTDSELAQRYFDQGLRLTYGYYFPEAVASLQEAARLDPDSAMIQWGLAFAISPNPNSRYFAVPDDPRGAGREAALRAATLAGEKELADVDQGLVDAMLVRLDDEAEPDREARDRRYIESLRGLRLRHPDDPEVGTLLADALMVTSPWSYWNPDGSPRPGTEEAAAALEEAVETRRDHPGANHLYIHLMEDSLDADLALPHADRLEDTMPGVGHIVHMPSHIYMRVGRYQQVVTANQRSTAADEEMAEAWGERDLPAAISTYGLSHRTHRGHALDFIRTAAAFQGNLSLVLETNHELVADVSDETLRNSGVAQRRYAATWTSLRRLRRWDAVLHAPVPPEGMPYLEGMWHFARGSAQAAKGRPDRAVRELEALRTAARAKGLDTLRVMVNPAERILELAATVLEGEIAAARGDHDTAVRLLDRAARLESRLAYMEPPDWDQPVQEQLGAVLLEAGHAEEAEAAFWEGLRRTPNSGWLLAGLLRSLEAQGDEAAARRIEARLEQAWRNADLPLPQ